MSFVLDTSVTMRWAFKDGSAKDRAYAASVLDALEGIGAVVPVTWGLEVANVLGRAERIASYPTELSEAFVEMLTSLDIRPDDATFHHALTDTIRLARTFRLSAYDASYLELALRLRIPLATLDEGLRKAARKARVERMTV